MKRIFRRNVTAAAVFAAIALTGTAWAVDEGEPNHPIQTAQPLIIPASGSVTVKGALGSRLPSEPLVADVDFYSFKGKAGDVVTIDIDDGMKSDSSRRSVDTWIGIFAPGSDFVRKALNDDVARSQGLDEGSTSLFDSRIDKLKLDKDGTWTVGVSSTKRPLGTGGILLGTALSGAANGEYTLTISGVTPSVLHINIEVKPGSGEFAPVNPKAKGTIPVALLSSAEFNALEVKIDPKTLTFGSTGIEQSLRRCGKEGEDVNGDGLLDLVCHFDNQLAKFAEDEDVGIVQGVTNAGLPFEGRGMLKVVPVKQEQ